MSFLAVSLQANAGAVLGKNLIKNPGAEAGEGSASGYTVVTVPKWTQAGNFTAVVYGASGFPTAGDPGPAKRGLNFFSGGPDNVSSSASQTINVSALAADIDAGTVNYKLSAFLGGFSTQNDQATLEADFTDKNGVVLGSATLPTVTAADRGNVTALLKRSAGGHVPVGTRKIEVLLLTMTRFAGAYNDGYADSLSLVLRSTAAEADADAGAEADAH